MGKTKTKKTIQPIIKRLFLDIETAPIVVWTWTTGYKINIGHDQILREGGIICISYKWEHENKVHHLQWNDGDDSEMLAKFIDVYNEADELIYHNGKRFDMNWIRTQAARYGLGRIDPKPDYDTLSYARSYFRFHSNKLDYISQFLLDEKKIRVPIDVWLRITFHNDPKAMAEMLRYCDKDVKLLQEVWEVLMSTVGQAKTHAGVKAGLPKWTCPWTGSTDVVYDKDHVTAKGTVKRVMRCLVNGRCFAISDRVFQDFLNRKYDV